MERRLLLAITLMIVVAVLPSLFLRRAAPPPRPDTTLVDRERVAAPVVVPAAPPVVAIEAVADTASLGGEDASYRFTSLGAAITRAEFRKYRSFHTGDTGHVSLVRATDRLLVHRLVLDRDTIGLDSVAFALQRGPTLTFSGQVGGGAIALRYRQVRERPFVLEVDGAATALAGRGGLLLIGLGSGFANVERDSLDNYRHYGISVRRGGPQVHHFRSVEPGAVQEVSGPFDWVALKSKYFLGAVLSPDSARPAFGGAALIGGPRPTRLATTAQVWVTMPVGPDGRFRYQVYLGPILYRTLHPLGRQLDRASPYGWIFRPVVMPAVNWITQLFLWMHENLRLSYGWVLVVFGVLVRLVLWPLNQRAMRSQVAMMAVQPILQDIQKRYKNDPQRLQQEMMKAYREHRVNPFGGCLPLMLPFPVLLALFFVFSNAIELRGTPFLWLPDLSLKDPLYVVPFVMGASMYALSKLSQLGMPANPQAKMMTIVMPVMMTVFFLNFASGVNLYYAVSNLVSLPQQYLINKARAAEMARRQLVTRS